MRKVAYLGPRGTYSHQATLRAFPSSSYDHVPCVDIPDIFHAVESGSTDLGVVPFENSTNGSVLLSLDLFCDRQHLYANTSVCSETFLPVHHCLLANQHTTLDNVQKVYSHPQAFGQCERFLGKHLKGIKRINVTSTSQAAKIVLDEDGAVAIASEINVELHPQLKILYQNIEDVKNNTTRFLVIDRSLPHFESTTEQQASSIDKFFISFKVEPNQPGALSNVLNVFKTFNLNLTSLQSRPTLEEPWTYIFLIEFEGHDDVNDAKLAVEEMKKYCLYFRVLGRYRKQQAG